MTDVAQSVLAALTAIDFPYRVAIHEDHDPELGAFVAVDALDVPEAELLATSQYLNKALWPIQSDRVLLGSAFLIEESDRREQEIGAEAARYQPSSWPRGFSLGGASAAWPSDHPTWTIVFLTEGMAARSEKLRRHLCQSRDCAHEQGTLPSTGARSAQWTMRGATADWSPNDDRRLWPIDGNRTDPAPYRALTA